MDIGNLTFVDKVCLTTRVSYIKAFYIAEATIWWTFVDEIARRFDYISETLFVNLLTHNLEPRSPTAKQSEIWARDSLFQAYSTLWRSARERRSEIKEREAWCVEQMNSCLSPFLYFFVRRFSRCLPTNWTQNARYETKLFISLFYAFGVLTRFVFSISLLMTN